MTDYTPGISQGDMAEHIRTFTVEDIIEREQAAGIRFGPVHRAWQLEKAPEHVKRMLARGRMEPGLLMTRQGFMGMDTSDVNPVSFSAINTTTSPSCFWNASGTAQQTTWAAIPASPGPAPPTSSAPCVPRGCASRSIASTRARSRPPPAPAPS